jgi:hypothetical protein
MSGELDLQINPIEAKASQVTAELNAVWNSEVTAENIRRFADKSLDKVAEIVTRVTKERFPGESITTAHEDLALGELGLEVTDTLNQLQSAIENKRLEINSIFDFVRNSAVTDTVLVPPSDKRFPPRGPDITGEKRFEINKVEMVIYILHHDFGISFEGIKHTPGVVLKTMVRKAPYERIEALGKVIYVCNETYNNTYVFDLTTLPEGMALSQLDQMTKEELEVLVKDHPNKNFALKFTLNWGKSLFQAINGTRIPRRKKDVSELNPNNLPEVIDDESDPYNGFALINGEYWGTVGRIRRILGLKQYTAEELVAGLQSKKIYHIKERDGYLLEEVKRLINPSEFPMGKMLDGEWRHFALLGEKHYARITTIGNKLGVNHDVLQNYIRANGIKPIKIFMYGQTQAYCYEDISDKIKLIKDIPLVATNNKYNEKLWVDDEGKHWGTFKVISTLSGASIRKVVNSATRNINIRVSEMGIAKGYCLEDILESIQQKPLHP